MITHELTRQGSSVLSYIDDLGWARDQATAATHLHDLQELLVRLGLQESKHKATPPSQFMVWLDLQFESVAIIVALPLTSSQ